MPRGGYTCTSCHYCIAGVFIISNLAGMRVGMGIRPPANQVKVPGMVLPISKGNNDALYTREILDTLSPRSSFYLSGQSHDKIPTVVNFEVSTISQSNNQLSTFNNPQSLLKLSTIFKEHEYSTVNSSTKEDLLVHPPNISQIATTFEKPFVTNKNSQTLQAMGMLQIFADTSENSFKSSGNMSDCRVMSVPQITESLNSTAECKHNNELIDSQPLQQELTLQMMADTLEYNNSIINAQKH